MEPPEADVFFTRLDKAYANAARERPERTPVRWVGKHTGCVGVNARRVRACVVSARGVRMYVCVCAWVCAHTHTRVFRYAPPR